MGLPAISSLANMEYMLYGGASNFNGNCPSMYNNYMAPWYNTYNPSFMGNNGYGYNGYGYGGYGYNPAMGGYYNPSIFANPQTAAATATAATAGLGAAAGATTTAAATNNKDLDVLAEYATKVNEGGETFGGALMGGVTFAAMENMQNVKHIQNAWKGMKNADKIFDLTNANIKALWEGKETSALMQDAYSQAQAASRRLVDKTGWFSQMFAKNLSPDDKKVVGDLLKDLKTAMETKNTDQIIEITQKLKDARGLDGKLIPGKALSATERIANKAEQSDKLIAEAKEALKTGEKWFTPAKFMKEFWGWFIFESVIEGVTKVLPAYMQGGSDSGHKQLAQSGLKAAASAGGWAIGRLAGSALGAKAGAAIGTAICPGIGTAAGAIIGFAGGCVGSWLAQKGAKALINSIWGKEESEKLAEAKMKQTQEGQAQLLQLAYQKAMSGEAPKEVVNSLNNLTKQAA